MANWSNPTLTSNYTNFLSELKDRDDDLAKAFDGTTSSNLATGTIRWNSTANRWQKWTGSVWAELTATYALTALTTTGNAGIGGTLAVTGATTLAAATATTPATDNNSTAVATTAYVRAQLYAPLASPALTGTPTVPTAAVGTNSTQAASTAFVLGNSVLKAGDTMTGTLAMTGGPVLTKNIPYAGSQNAAYLIAGTTSYTGAATNLGTYGLQHRIKANSGGTFRITVDGPPGELFCINEIGRVGIGTGDPATALDVNGDVTLTDKIIHRGDTDTAIRFPVADTVSVETGGAEVMRFTSNQYLRMAAGTGGIQFGGDTAAANALNDYEEGTFTPTVIGTGTAGTGTYQAQVGRYTKIGDVVRFSIFVAWDGHTGTVNMRLAGLPFTTLNVDDSSACFSILPTSLTFSDNLAAIGVQNSTQVNLLTYSSNATNAALPIDTTGSIRVSGVYEVA
jgi:hypothetical protein